MISFDSDYIYGTGSFGCILTGRGSTPSPPTWPPQPGLSTAPITGGNGNMMVVNKLRRPGDSVWCQTVTVQPNTEYAFSAWVTSVVSQNLRPAVLHQRVPRWARSTTPPQPPAVGSNSLQFTTPAPYLRSRICIVNVNENPAGNDFALDDIAFNPVCEYQDSVTVTLVRSAAGSGGELATAPPAPYSSCTGYPRYQRI